MHSTVQHRYFPSLSCSSSHSLTILTHHSELGGKGAGGWKTRRRGSIRKMMDKRTCGRKEYWRGQLDFRASMELPISSLITYGQTYWKTITSVGGVTVFSMWFHSSLHFGHLTFLVAYVNGLIRKHVTML